MRKQIFIVFMLCLILNPVYAADIPTNRVYGILENSYQHQKDIVNTVRAGKANTLFQALRGTSSIEPVIQKIKELPDSEPYEILNGNNPTKKPITVEFKKLSEFGEQYKDFDALGWKAKGRLYIFINNKHKDVSSEALAALVTGRVYNFDEADSINEEIYCWAAEGFAWEYFTRKNPKLKEANNSLVERENEINKMLTRGRYSVEYINKSILLNRGYASYAQNSEGYSNEELEQKLDRLKKIYNYNVEDNN